MEERRKPKAVRESAAERLQSERRCSQHGELCCGRSVEERHGRSQLRDAQCRRPGLELR